MPAHPCADHYATCDHCDRCDRLGECCMTSSASVQASTDYRTTGLSVLRQAIASDQDSRASLTELVQADVATSTIRRLLGGAPRTPEVPTAPIRSDCPPALPSPRFPDLLTHQPQERKGHHGLTAPQHDLRH